MRFVLIFLALFFLLIFQSGVLPSIGFGTHGNLLLIFAVISIILSDFEESFFTILVSGLMLDLISASRAGLWILSMLAVFGFTLFLVNKIITREPKKTTLLACVAANTFVLALVFVLANRFVSYVHLDTILDWRYVLGKKLFFDVIANLLLTLPVFYFHQFLERSKRFAAEIL